MSTLLVQAHPLDESYNTAVLDAALAGLRDAGVDPEVVRLAQGQTVTAEMVESCRHLVLVAPTWWGGPPAVVLDWLQQTLGPWIDGQSPVTASPFRSIRRVSVACTHGSSRLKNRMQGEPGLHLWKRSVLPVCAPDAIFDWIALYKIDRSTPSERQHYLRHVRWALAEAGRP